MPETLHTEAAASRVPAAPAIATAPEPAAINAAAKAETVAQTAHSTGHGAAREPDGAREPPDSLPADEQVMQGIMASACCPLCMLRTVLMFLGKSFAELTINF